MGNFVACRENLLWLMVYSVAVMCCGFWCSLWRCCAVDIAVVCSDDAVADRIICSSDVLCFLLY